MAKTSTPLSEEKKDQTAPEVTDKSGIVDTQDTLSVVEEESKDQTTPEPEKEGKVETVVVSEKKPKEVKVKFMKDHTFSIGIDKIEAKKGQVKMVELHTANKLVSRMIAHLM